MKTLFSALIVVSIVGLLVAPGLAGGLPNSIPGPGGPGGRIQHVTIIFEHDTSTDVYLAVESLPDLGLICSVVQAQATLTGDIEGEYPLLSDVGCFNSLVSWFDATTARIEAVGYIKGTLAESGEPINMSGRMTLDIDLTDDRFNEPSQMRGYLVSQEGVGTHYGAFLVEGTVAWEVDRFVGRGTFKGWVRENKTGKSH
jgi:hypothetical protein